jgi:ubiquinone/menaquinone biosynthesis C-methylase UbiE
MNSQRPHWETTSRKWQGEQPQRLWRQHSDAVNLALVQRWWPDKLVESVLKTDLFDEVFGEGLYPFMHSRARTVSGIDISESIVSAARMRCPELQAAVADVRSLPFASDKIDLIISNSTLDHFEAATDIAVAVAELYRVLRPGGQLLLTLDNLLNPKIALRQALPFRLLHALGLAPYFVGSTLGPRGLCRVVRQAGFQVIDTAVVMHCPRVIAVGIAGLLQRHAGHLTQLRFLRSLAAFEKLSYLPTRSLSGHFVAVRAVK